jgi:hypothetical protein
VSDPTYSVSSYVLLSVHQDDEITLWANDSIRFIKMHWKELRENPLEVYKLFAFAPKSSIFATIYAKSTDFPHPVVTIGLEDDWPSHVRIKVHQIETRRLSRCENWLMTGGADGPYPVYGLWNVRLRDGEVYIHPCGVTGCRVTHVIIYLHDTTLQLQTFCKCGSLYRWDTSSSPPTLIEEIKFDRQGEGDDFEYDQNWNWSEDGRMVVTYKEHEGDSWVHFLWRDDHPEDYYELPSGRWNFSPGRGEKLACRSTGFLEVWDSITCTRLFNKEFSGPYSISFSPDGKTIIVPESQRINCVLAENGTVLWSIEAKWDITDGYIHEFFPNGTMALISREENLYIIRVADGSTLYGPQKRPRDDLCFIPHPVDERMVIIEESGGGVLLWNPPNNSGIQKYGEAILWAESMFLSREFSWKYMTLIETSMDRISFSYIDLSWPFLPQSRPKVSTFGFSHNGLNLVMVSDASLVTLWDTNRGIQLISTHLCQIYPSEEIQLEFTRDSSHLLVWRTISSEIQIIDIARLSIRSLNIFDFRMIAFFSNSRRILVIDGHRNVNVNSFEGQLLDTPSHLSFSPSIVSCSQLTISSDDRLMAIICRGSLIIKEIFGHTPEFEWPGSCFSMAFTIDCAHILVAEYHISQILRVSHLRLSDMTVQNRWIEKECDYSAVAITRYDTNTFVIQKGDHKTRWTGQSLIFCFDLSSGMRSLPVFLHQEGYSILYSKHPIMSTRDKNDEDDAGRIFSRSCLDHLIMKDWDQVVTIDMSSVIQYT